MFRLSNTAIGYAHDVGPIPKPVLFVVFSVWLTLIDFVWEMFNVSLLPFVWLGNYEITQVWESQLEQTVVYRIHRKLYNGL